MKTIRRVGSILGSKWLGVNHPSGKKFGPIIIIDLFRCFECRRDWDGEKSDHPLSNCPNYKHKADIAARLPQSPERK